MLTRPRLLPLVAVLIASGCAGMGMPNWSHPGSAPQQQRRALRFDPYPENETGPELEGVRPREYDRPPPEATRAQWRFWQWGG